jgi:hypothetical protein
MNPNHVLITNLYFGDPKWGTEKDIFAEVSSCDTGEICLRADLNSVMQVIEKNNFIVLNEEEVIEIVNIMLNIDYSKYGTEKFWGWEN